MYEITLENKNGDTLTFNDNSPFTIIGIEGLSAPEATVNISEIALFDGGRYNSSKANVRTINLAFAIEYETAKNRIEVYKVLKAKQWIKFNYKGDYRDVYIEGYIESMPIAFGDMKQSVTVSILCPYPYFKQAQEIINSMDSVIKMFHFEFAIAPKTNEEHIAYSSNGKVAIMNDVKDSTINDVTITGESSQVITKQGKNLFDFDKFCTNKNVLNGTWDSTSDNSFTMTCTSTTTRANTRNYLVPDMRTNIEEYQGKKITFSWNKSNEAGIVNLHFYNKTNNTRLYVVSSYTNSRTVDILDTYYFAAIEFIVPIDNTVTWSNIQYEVGNFVTEYEAFTPNKPSPYYQSVINDFDNGNLLVKNADETQNQTVNIPYVLRSLPTGACDEIYKQNNKWYFKKAIETITFNGSEAWVYSLNTNGLLRVYYGISNMVSGAIPKMLCDHFKVLPTNTTQECITYQDNKAIAINIRESIASNLAEFKTWLGANNITVQYQLNTPVITEITNTTLVNALNGLIAYEPTTKMSLSDVGYAKFTTKVNHTGEGGEVISYIDNLIQIVVNNEGDVETGFRIELYARNEVVNPKVFNYVTGDFIGVDYTMAAGDVITINTKQGEKTITLLRSSVETNLFNYLTEGSKWLTLDYGETLFYYEAATGVTNLNVTFKHYNEFEGV